MAWPAAARECPLQGSQSDRITDGSWPVSAQNFFGIPNVTNADGTPCDTDHKSQPFLSDPRALYDPADGRFWAINPESGYFELLVF